ncbi:MAG: glycosyltransferase family 4 protein [Gemmatimonadales bacterium]
MTGTTCIIGVDDNRVLKDFVRAHVEYLSNPKICLDHWYPDFRYEGQTIRYFYSSRPLLKRAEKLLPHALYSRLIARSEHSPAAIDDAYTAFFREKNVDVILAEFGGNGAEICPHAKRLGIPLIVHFHGHDAHRTSEVEAFRDRYREMFDYAFRIVSVSRMMTDTLVELGADPARIVFNPYGPRDKFFEIEPTYSGNVMSLGRFTDIKANYLTLAAFRLVLESHPDATLTMAGAGELMETCRTLASLWGMERSVSFPGAVNHAETRSLFAAASMFVQHSVTPSYGDAEGTPVTILEASAAGLPVVSTNHAGIREAVVQGVTGYLVEERDVEGMARHISGLLDNPAACREMGARARQHIKENYSMKRHIGILQELIDAARERREPRAAALVRQDS